MGRRWVALLFVLSLAIPAAAKMVCPPGRFVIRATDGPGMALDGRELELGRGIASLSGGCGPARGTRFLRGMGRWVNHVRTARLRCGGGRWVRVRALFSTTEPYCANLEGTLITQAGRRVAFSAGRIPECGNGLREPGEQCDGTDSAAFGTCCTETCTVKPDCPVQCDAERFPCAAGELCTYTCGFTGVCQPAARVDCGDGPVCGCDTVTTYADRCAAFAAGTGASHDGPCSALGGVQQPR
jgi:hypothetical protein